MRRTAIVAVLVALLASFVPARAAAADATPVTYAPPVPGPVVDDFRPPVERWGPGNRGVDFAAAPGDPVAAAAPGEVVFAGTVAGTRHVVVLHADGLRTSYSFLDTVGVRRGDRVEAGAVVGLAGGAVHFGVRAGDVYLDPLALLAGPPRVHLVPEASRRAVSEAEERGRLERFVRSIPGHLGRVGAAAVGWARREVGDRLEEARLVAHYVDAAVTEYAPWAAALDVGAAVQRWRSSRTACTPAAVPPPARTERHLLVQVAGLGSHAARGAAAGAVADVDETALGYGPGDVVQFSYAGGTTADTGYSSADSQVPLRESARRFRALLEGLAAAHPGVPIDIVAHSQGGLVARAALVFEFDGADPRLPPVRSLVTLGTPHRGADLATALRLIDQTDRADTALDAASVARPIGIDPRAPSVLDLAETSPFVAAVDRAPLPAGVRVTSIAARRDLVVPARRTRVAGATNVVVDPGGLANQHDALPGSAAAAREIALALAGAPPTCESLADAVLDVAVPHAIAAAQDSAALGAAYLLARSGRAGGR